MTISRGYGRHDAGLVIAALAILAIASTPAGADPQQSESSKRPYTSDFALGTCTFSATGGNPYVILRPGHQLLLRGEEGGEEIEALVTVLDETEPIDLPGLGTIVTRVVEEREWVDGGLAEVSRNFYAVCDRTGDVLYFGEDVDIFEEDGTVSHEGAWRAGDNGAMPGLFMPGSFLLGSRYYQEVAPGVALDRAENTATGLSVEVPAGTFVGCGMVFETNGLDSSGKDTKVYAPGVGVIVDGPLTLHAWVPAP